MIITSYRTYAEVSRLVQKAYAKLRKLGYVCKSNFSCCTSCASYAISQMPTFKHKTVYWHRQNTDGFKKCSPARMDNNWLHLGWEGFGTEIAAAMREVGLEVDWDGTEEKKIAVR